MNKWNRTFAFVMALAMVLGTLVLTPKTAQAMGGRGTEADPYTIYTAADLKLVGRELNAHYVLMNDIDLGWEEFEMIGDYANPFTGSFNGNGYAIRNLKITNNTYSRLSIGLFARIDGATIKDTKVINAEVLNTITKTGTAAKITTGALVGEMLSGNIINCSVEGEGFIEGASAYTGGLIGYVLVGSLENCYAKIDVRGSGYTGGLVGYSSSLDLSRCYYVGNINSLGSAGGIAGYALNVKECYAIASIKAQSGDTGGIIPTGINIEDCFFIGNISTVATATGISQLSNSSGNKIFNCYAAAELTGKLKYGVGRYLVTNCYFDSALTESNNYEHGKLTNVMVLQETYEGWDFDNIWAIDEGYSYPYLRNLPKPDEVNVYPREIPETGITLYPSSHTMAVGDQLQLSWSITPSNATNQNVTFSSSRPSVATISATGQLRAISTGTATITVTTANGKTATCIVTVTSGGANPGPGIPVESITLTPTSKTMTVGETLQLSTTILPANATNKTVTFVSSNSNVAAVSQTGGLVQAKSPGTITISAITHNNLRTTCVITVVDNGAGHIPVEDIIVDPGFAEMEIGDTLTINPIVLPANATNKNVTWHSSNPAVATVDQYGRVTAHSSGFTAIAAITVDGGLVAFCNIEVLPGTVIIPVEGIAIIPSTLTLEEGERATAEVEIYPSNATNQQVSWGSTNTSVAVVNSMGVIHAVGIGTATITVTSMDGYFTDACEVVVTEADLQEIPVESVALNQNTLALEIGATETLIATIQPSDATNQNTAWESSDDTIAVVDQNGTVTAIGEGAAIITVTTQDGGYTADCTVTVEDEPTPVEPENLALDASASSNSYLNNNRHPSKAIDGDMDTSWLAEADAEEVYLELDFGQEITFNELVINEVGNRIGDYQIEIWDGSSWEVVDSGFRIGSNCTISLNTYTTAKIRLNILNKYNNNANGYAIYEFEVYNRS